MAQALQTHSREQSQPMGWIREQVQPRRLRLVGGEGDLSLPTDRVLCRDADVQPGQHSSLLSSPSAWNQQPISYWERLGFPCKPLKKQ